VFCGVSIFSAHIWSNIIFTQAGWSKFGRFLRYKLLLLLAIILVTIFMQGIYNYIPETHNYLNVYNFAAIQWLRFFFFFFF
jgi:hypothetical protein